MRVLLDSHTLIWAADDSTKIPAAALSLLQDPRNERFINAATIWEIAIKVGKGRLPLSLAYRAWMDKAMADLCLSLLPITLDHAERQSMLPPLHRPAFVTVDAGYDLRIDGGRLYRSVPGYLGLQHAPLAVNEPTRGLENLRHAGADLDARLELLAGSERRFADEYALPAVSAPQAAYEWALRLMNSRRSRAFNLDDEPAQTREEYGLHRFGQSCLLARRLVEAGVNFVEVFHRGWGR